MTFILHSPWLTITCTSISATDVLPGIPNSTGQLSSLCLTVLPLIEYKPDSLPAVTKSSSFMSDSNKGLRGTKDLSGMMYISDALGLPCLFKAVQSFLVCPWCRHAPIDSSSNKKRSRARCVCQLQRSYSMRAHDSTPCLIFVGCI